MRWIARPITIAALLAVWLGHPGGASALSARDDRAKLFSTDALAKATAGIEEMKEQYRKDLRIHTDATIPWMRDKWGKVKKMDEAARQQFFTEWARADARKSGTDGVFILICKEPLNVRVIVRLRGPTKPITFERGEKLQEEMLALLKEKKNDEALQLAVSVFQEKLHAQYGDTFVNPAFNWSSLASVLLAAVGAWLALCFMHGFSEGTFRVGGAGVNPLGLGAGNLFAELRAVHGGLASTSHPTVHVSPDAPTLTEVRSGSADDPLPPA